MNLDLAAARTLLFTPANRPERFSKAIETAADGLILDLEDAVALQEKDITRSALIEYLHQKAFPRPTRPFILAVRINSLQTLAGLKDITAFLEARAFPDAFVFPKVESAHEIALYDHYFNLPECASLQYLALIETAKGLETASQIASASPRLRALALGGVDLATDLGAQLSWEPLLFARSRLVQAAKSAELGVLDVPFLDLHNELGLQQEASRVRDLGYTGKLAIHPAQTSTLSTTFSPSQNEIQEAQDLVKRYEAAQGNVFDFKGKMVDAPVYRNALRVLAR